MNTDYKTKTKAAIVVNALVNYCRCTIEQLTEKIGAGKSTQLYSMANGKTANVSRRFAKMICDTFPEISYDWVLNAEGPMFCKGMEPQEEAPQPQTPQSPDYAAIMLNMLNMIIALQQDISRLSTEVFQLRSVITAQTTRIDNLVDEITLSKMIGKTSVSIAPSSMLHRESSPYKDLALADESEIKKH